MGFFDLFRKKQQAAAIPENKERRLLPRWEVSVPAQAKWEGLVDYVNCEIRDMNFRGFKIVLPQKLEEQCTKLVLRFNEDFILNAEFCILWHAELHDKHIYGCSFTRLRDQDKEKMYDFVFKNFPDQIEKHIQGK